MDPTNDSEINISDNINNDPFVISFKTIVHCLPVHNYIINIVFATITYYCGNNNTITLSLDAIKNQIQDAMNSI